MGKMTTGDEEMTITLPPQVETPLRRRAAQAGMDADALAGAILLDALG